MKIQWFNRGRTLAPDDDFFLPELCEPEALLGLDEVDRVAAEGVERAEQRPARGQLDRGRRPQAKKSRGDGHVPPSMSAIKRTIYDAGIRGVQRRSAAAGDPLR